MKPGCYDCLEILKPRPGVVLISSRFSLMILLHSVIVLATYYSVVLLSNSNLVVEFQLKHCSHIPVEQALLYLALFSTSILSLIELFLAPDRPAKSLFPLFSSFPLSALNEILPLAAGSPFARKKWTEAGIEPAISGFTSLPLRPTTLLVSFCHIGPIVSFTYRSVT